MAVADRHRQYRINDPDFDRSDPEFIASLTDVQFIEILRQLRGRPDLG